MARFYPDKPAADTPKSERDVWVALERLPNSWRVFHSVAWQVPQAKRVFDGEADFVLIHSKHGMIVLEVKGGLLQAEDGTWSQRDAARCWSSSRCLGLLGWPVMVCHGSPHPLGWAHRNSETVTPQGSLGPRTGLRS